MKHENAQKKILKTKHNSFIDYRTDTLLFHIIRSSQITYKTWYYQINKYDELYCWQHTLQHNIITILLLIWAIRNKTLRFNIYSFLPSMRYLQKTNNSMAVMSEWVLVDSSTLMWLVAVHVYTPASDRSTLGNDRVWSNTTKLMLEDLRHSYDATAGLAVAEHSMLRLSPWCSSFMAGIPEMWGPSEQHKVYIHWYSLNILVQANIDIFHWFCPRKKSRILLHTDIKYLKSVFG